MNYESTTFLFRNGSDDYTLWVVDLRQYRTEKMRNKGKCGKIWAWISK